MGLFYTIDDKSTVKYLVATMLTVNLAKSKDLAVGQRASQFLGKLLQVAYLFIV